MHGYSRLGNGGATGRSVTATTTPSPPSSPRLRHSRGSGKSNSSPGAGFAGGGGGRGGGEKQNLVERLMFLIIKVVLKRRGLLLLAPLLYISGMVLYMGSLNFDVNLKNGGVVVRKRAAPGTVYRSPKVFQKLWPYMEAERNRSNNALMESISHRDIVDWDWVVCTNTWTCVYRCHATLQLLMTAWNPKWHQGWKPCGISNNSEAELPESNGFLIIEANGGLNQQRLSICDAVAVAGLLNATLVIPIFHLNSVWRDSSKFGEIFDEDIFTRALKNNVKVVRELPSDILEHFDNNISSIVNLRVKAWSSTTYYLQKVLPKLRQMRAVRIAPFSNRLAHAVPPNIQGLRCLANFEALQFSEPIRMLAEKMVDRMIKNSSQSRGKYDMVAFSCCEYDGGEEEKREMDIARESAWRGKFRRRGRVIRPGANRVDGKCPLTPLEVGMMLRGMGFDNTTAVYVAAGNIYKAEKYMAPLKQMFPRLETKDTIATAEELAPFKGHSSRLAALDYTVCLHSEVFVTTQGGNFPHFLMGHRRYLYGGHAKTIKPDKRKLALIFDKPSISSALCAVLEMFMMVVLIPIYRWEVFKRQMQDMLHHSDVKGSELRKPSSSLYTFPMPDCMCRPTEATHKDGDS
ncbi:hypothetical protein SADUNF_Sadunf13G0087200 [Salix dunnii]|uniref:O-fucosyltransferase family protein n=1 Tax=Salix dunnii TaxID=1413687 RepID=A0A835JLG1_9ROSI|nr:hypothetical protein SADUNF_Sadunf13G0087200 [Salix dunnii]